MRKAKQRDFFEDKIEHGPRRTKHGGGLGKNRRKIARPFKRNKPIHIVLKSSQAKGAKSFLSASNKLEVNKIINTRAAKSNAKIHAKQNVGNHIHLLMTFYTKAALTKFLRSVTALIARHVTKASKGRPAGKKFWDEIPFTRLVDGLRDFREMLGYILKNRIEAEYGAEARGAMEEFAKAAAGMRGRIFVNTH